MTSAQRLELDLAAMQPQNSHRKLLTFSYFPPSSNQLLSIIKTEPALEGSLSVAPPKRARSTTKRALPARAPLHIHARQRRDNKRNDHSDHSGDEDGDGDGDGDEEQLSGGEDEGDDDTGSTETTDIPHTVFR